MAAKRPVYVPQCCPANRKNAFVVATKYRREGGEVWGVCWRSRIVDHDGLIHEISTRNCPVCGAHLQGLEHKIRGRNG